MFVTPPVIGGAEMRAEFRLPTFVNLVRWWWRFLALGRLESAEAAAFWDAALWGWHAKPFGERLVRFRLAAMAPRQWSTDWRESILDYSGVRYLTAQAFDNRAPVNVGAFRVTAEIADQPRIGPALDFWFPQSTKQPALSRTECAFADARRAGSFSEWAIARKTLEDALALIGLIGGLGSRVRRGFGSLALLGLSGDAEMAVMGLPTDKRAYCRQVGVRLDKPFLGTPPYSALSSGTAVRVLASAAGWRELMNDVGWAFQIYRSWGQPRGRGHVHEKRPGPHALDAGAAKAEWYKNEFQDDHNLLKRSGFAATAQDHRAIFGLPHNYGDVPVGWSCDYDDTKHRRRASPLMFHFHRLATGEHIVVASVMPSQFLPSGALLQVGNPGNLRRYPAFPSASEAGVGWNLLNDFCDFVSAPRFPAGGPRLTPSGGVPHTSYTPVPASEGTILP